jgi:cytochrome b6-f complex iron-sulfur subunit
MMERKDFLKAACGLCGLAILPTALTSCSKSDNLAVPGGNFTVDLGAPGNAALTSDGGSMIINDVLVINTGGGFTALQSNCTHQGCTVGYNESSNRIVCPCHGGTYDINGNVVSGPPPAALHKYSVTQSGPILNVAS